MKIQELPISVSDRAIADHHRKKAYDNMCELLNRDPEQEFPLIRSFVDNVVNCAIYEYSIASTKAWNDAVRKG